MKNHLNNKKKIIELIIKTVSHTKKNFFRKEIH